MMLGENAVVGLLGATGNLGSSFAREFRSLTKWPLEIIGRPAKLAKNFNITEDGLIQSSSGKFPDLIINLSNFYIPNPNFEQDREMHKIILGVADAISNTIDEAGCSVISASTYFQYCPIELRPWSRYSALKTESKMLIQSAATRRGANFTDFVLYDNYGGSNRNKFVDLLEQSLLNGLEIDCTDGQQVLNLTHVSDLALALVSEVIELSQAKNAGLHTYELRSDFTVSLRELVLKAELASGRQAIVNWGAIPYRDREVFELWQTGFSNPPYWQPLVNFETYVKQKFSQTIRVGRDS